MKATRKDVANLAGVSTATVSYVLNGTRKVSSKTHAKVLNAVETLRYAPDMVARGLATRCTMHLSVVVNDVTNPLYGEIIRSFESEAANHGYFVSICSENAKFSQYLNDFRNRHIDGVLILAVPAEKDMEEVYQLARSGVPVVMSGNTQSDLELVSSIECDYLDGMRQVVSHLAGLGHREIAYLSGLGEDTAYDARVSGFRAAMDENGLDSSLLIAGDPPFHTTCDDGVALCERLLCSRKPFTAMICTNDLMAIGAMHALIDHGVRVPADVSLVGMDDIAITTMMNPPLTSIGMDKDAFGRQAFHVLLQRMRLGVTGCVRVPLRLAIRGSSARVSQDMA